MKNYGQMLILNVYEKFKICFHLVQPKIVYMKFFSVSLSTKLQDQAVVQCKWVKWILWSCSQKKVKINNVKKNTCKKEYFTSETYVAAMFGFQEVK